jgi:purine-cytosine permease-like protein
MITIFFIYIIVAVLIAIIAWVNPAGLFAGPLVTGILIIIGVIIFIITMLTRKKIRKRKKGGGGCLEAAKKLKG